MRAVLLLALAGYAAADVTRGSYPVRKVIELLEGMKKTMQTEVDADQKVYDKFYCWCETNGKEKEKAVEDAMTRISELRTTMDQASATTGKLSTQIKLLEQETEKEIKTLAEAQAIRDKQAEEYHEQNKEMRQTIQALSDAVEILKKHHTPALVQNLGKILQMGVERGFKATAEQRVAIQALQGPPGSLSSYTAQSGEIYGILQGMKDSFTNDADAATAEEKSRAEAFVELKKAKAELIQSNKDQIQKKTEQNAEALMTLADAKNELDALEKTLDADRKYLMDLKLRCDAFEREWEKRTKTRHDEAKAINKAIEILSADDSEDAFNKAFNKGFLQVSRSSSPEQRAAAQVLAEAGRTLKAPKLSALAVSARLDSFTVVISQIDKRIEDLKVESGDESNDKDECVSTIQENKMDLFNKGNEVEDHTKKKELYELQIETLKTEKKETEDEMARTKTEMQRASSNRNAANTQFQEDVKDQKKAQELLAGAIQVLKDFYAKHGMALTQQAPAAAGPPPPEGFKKYSEQTKGAGGVIALLQQILDDSRVVEVELQQEEDRQQKDYEGFFKDSNLALEDMFVLVNEKDGQIVVKEKDLLVVKKDLKAAQRDFQSLSEEKANLHKQCAFLLNNYDARSKARAAEIEALHRAKMILRGADFGKAFLQRHL